MLIPMMPKAGTQSGKDAQITARSALSEVALLRGELERNSLITQALWELLKKKMAVTEDELLEMIHAVDLLDGKLDGKPTRSPVLCLTCQRPASLTTNSCFFCGTPVARTSVF